MKLSVRKISVPGGAGVGAVRLELPLFSEECEAGRRLNDFYRILGQRLTEGAAAHGCVLLGELYPACNDGRIISFYLDLLCYRGRELIAIRRISDTRTEEGLVPLLPSALRRKLPKNGGWYYDGTDCVIYENRFTPGTGQGVRRSEYRRFIVGTRFPMRWEQGRRGARSGTGGKGAAADGADAEGTCAEAGRRGDNRGDRHAGRVIEGAYAEAGRGDGGAGSPSFEARASAVRAEDRRR